MIVIGVVVFSGVVLGNIANAQAWTEATKAGERRTAAYSVHGGSHDCVVSSSGQARCAGVRGFVLPLERGDFIQKLFALGTGADLIFAYQSGNDETGGCRVVAVSEATLELKWERRIEGFNLGLPGVANGYAYLTAAGFIGKLDLMTGQWIWKHDDLHKQFGRFESFDQPVLRRGLVIVRELDPAAFEHEERSSLVVDDDTGNILEPKSAKGA